MPWRPLVSDDVLSRLTQAEEAAFDSAGEDASQADRLTEILADVTELVRGKVASCARNRDRMGPPGTIPDELRLAALNIARYELGNALPGMGSLIDDLRRVDYQNALSLLDAAARCELALVPPGQTGYDAGPSFVGGEPRLDFSAGGRRCRDWRPGQVRGGGGC